MSAKIWIILEQKDGEVHPASWEALGAGLHLAESLGGEVGALALGTGAAKAAETAFQYGASEAVYCDDATLADYRAEPYASAVSKALSEAGAEVCLLATTTQGREVAAMVAIDLETGVMPDVTELSVEDGKVVVTRPVYAGKLLAKTVCDTAPALITTRVRAFAKPEQDESKSGTATAMQPVVAEEDIASKVTGYSQAEAGVSLTDAAVIVSGGRGVSNRPQLEAPAGMDDKEAEIWRAHQGFKLVGELAEVLGAAVGASRAAVDAGYIPYEHQVGQTGKVVSPDLYIACGISGAIQHLAGMRTSKVIVAVNKDPEAPIFKLARFGVVADLYDVLPALTEAFQEKLDK